MSGTSTGVITITFLLFLFHSAFPQDSEIDEWDVPWTILGDSTDIPDKESILVITGTITNSNTRKPISGASVSVDFFKHFDYTDENGMYVLEVPPGDYKVRIKHVGLLPEYLRIKVFSNATLDVDMAEGVVQLKEILITSRPIDSNIKESLAGLTKMNIQEIRTLPTLMGEVDIVKSLQLMPGVTSVGEGSSGINVRGGRVDQNLVLLNDVPLFNTSHALGFVSAFNQDIIDNFSLYKGNVPANLGGRASSVIEINTRRGNFDKWQFQAGAGPISSRLTVEGPLISDRTSVLLAGRISHANWFLKKIKDPNVNSSKVSFNDAYAGLSHRFSENSTADLTFYNSHDEFQFSDRFGYAWDNYIINGRWQALADRKLSPILSVSYGHFQSKLFEPSGVDASQITNTLNYAQLKESINYIPHEKHNMVAGVSAIAYIPRAEQLNGYGPNSSIVQKTAGKSSGLELSVFLNDDYEVTENIALTLGVRYSQYYHVGPDTTFQYMPGQPRSVLTITDTSTYSDFRTIKSFGGFEPRISARISLRSNQSVKLSYNRMRQYIHLISNTTAPTPIDLWQVSTEFSPPQIADNFSVGYFLNLKDNRWETSAELFYKKMENLVEYKDFPVLFLNTHLETELLSAKGRAFGGEVFIRRLKGKWTGWLSYTYSHTEVLAASDFEGLSINRGDWFPSNYNKPHNVNLVLNRNWRRQSAFSLIFSYNTGRPFTAIESSYVANGTVVPIYSERNKYQIPNYFRMDLSFTIGNIFKKVDDSFVFSLYNLFGRDNAYSVFYQRPASNFFIPKPYKLSVLGAPLPSITYNIKF
jgi:hypothetical protein